MKKILLILGIAFGFIAQAAAQVTVIETRLEHKKYPHRCYALSCFHTPEEKASDLRLSLKVAQNSCNKNLTGGNLSMCEGDKESHQATVQCYEQHCARAVCTKKNITTGQCISGAHFR